MITEKEEKIQKALGLYSNFHIYRHSYTPDTSVPEIDIIISAVSVKHARKRFFDTWPEYMYENDISIRKVT